MKGFGRESRGTEGRKELEFGSVEREEGRVEEEEGFEWIRRRC